jgi:hypothetical protein
VATVLVNLTGILALILVARVVQLFKAKPWTRQPQPHFADPTTRVTSVEPSRPGVRNASLNAR